MEKLKRRVAALESANPPADKLTIIRRFVSPGQLDAEIYGLRDDDGNLWARLPGEAEQGLIDRASLEAKRNPASSSSASRPRPSKPCSPCTASANS